MNNFTCKKTAAYTGSTTYSLNGSRLEHCSAHDLSRLTENGKINVTGMEEIVLVSEETEAVDIRFDSAATTGVTTFQISNMKAPTFYITEASLTNTGHNFVL